MSTRTILSTVGRLVLGGAVVISSGCGGDLLRTGRSPVYLTIENMTASAGNDGDEGAFLMSDVQVLVEQTVNGVTVQVPTVFNDSVTATISSNKKSQDPDSLTTPLNSVTLTRYHVEFRRTDGRNTPGVDVPFGFDGGLGITIPAEGSAEVAIDLVRHQAKLEPPLKNLVSTGGLGFISTIAEITFYGRDQNGNEVSVSGRIDVQFADFGDE